MRTTSSQCLIVKFSLFFSSFIPSITFHEKEALNNHIGLLLQKRRNEKKGGEGVKEKDDMAG